MRESMDLLDSQMMEQSRKQDNIRRSNNESSTFSRAVSKE